MDTRLSEVHAILLERIVKAMLFGNRERIENANSTRNFTMVQVQTCEEPWATLAAEEIQADDASKIISSAKICFVPW